jgi:hypothetical protein
VSFRVAILLILLMGSSFEARAVWLPTRGGSVSSLRPILVTRGSWFGLPFEPGYAAITNDFGTADAPSL